MDYIKLYNTNNKIKRFVDDYIRASNISIEDALSHKVVQAVIESYLQGGANYGTRTL